jgi:putative endonuclease
MFFVYFLRDEKGVFYKGVTGDLDRRLAEHKRGKTKATRKMKNLKVVYVEEYKTFKEARKREVYFKTAAGRRFFKNKLPA